MPKNITHFSIFIASPGGLEKERKEFKETIAHYNETEARHRGIFFEPVGWEATIDGVGRPQEKINEDLRACDYSIFLFRDRWGSPPDDVNSPFTSGTEEEFAIAMEMYAALKMRDIKVVFFPVSESQLKDPGKQLERVLAFKSRLEKQEKILFKQLKNDTDFKDLLRKHLAGWLRQIESEKYNNESSTKEKLKGLEQNQSLTGNPEFQRHFNKALVLVGSKSWHKSLGLIELALENTNKNEEICDALLLQAFILSELNLSLEELAVYDELLARFGGRTEAGVVERLARAIFNKGATLGQLNRSDEAIAVYDELLARFGGRTEAGVVEQLLKARLYKDGLSCS